MAKYGVGILGAGWVAGEYVKAFRDHPLTEIVGIYNRTPGKATQLMETHGVQAREFASDDELFDDEKIQIVVSCTSPDARVEHVVRAAETGRHVVIEKPVALTMEGVEEVRDAIVKAGVKSVTSFVLRWNPQFETTKQLIADGVLGDVIYAEGDYWHPISKLYPCYDWMMTKEVGGSATVAAGCHAVDALRWFAGDIEEVTAFSRGPKVNLDYEYDPVSVACVRFESGAIGKLATLLDGETPYIFNTRLFGTTGTIMNNEVFSRKHYPGATDYWEYPTVKPDSGDVAHHPFVPEIAHFMECIENDVESHASIHDSWKSMAVCFAIDESAAQGGTPVRLAEIAHV
jgi:predicted dehydrogenase